MEVYIVRDREGDIWPFAFTDKEMAEHEACDLSFEPNKYHVVEIDLPFVSHSVCYIHGYYGIGGDFGIPMKQIIRNSSIYACTEHAKKDKMWIDAIAYMKNHLGKYHIKETANETYVATDKFGEPFYWGYDGFNVSIKRIRVIR